MRLDASVGIPIRAGGEVASGSSAAVGLEVPVAFSFDIIEPLHVGVNTGLIVDDFSAAGDTTGIPLGIFGGYAIGDKRPIVDIDPFFNFFSFITPGSPIGVAQPGIFTVGVSARGYIYF
jgi:hypothetical protein